MLKTFIPVIAIFILVDSLSAQEKPTSGCPTVSVLGPAGVTEPGGVMKFTSSIEGKDLENLTYTWTVAGGTMVSGQGTKEIAVRVPGNVTSFTITATLDVEGLPKGCPSSASETAGGGCKCIAQPVDEYGPLSWSEERIRLKTVRDLIPRIPGSKLFIIRYFTGTVKSRDVNRIEQFLVRNEHLTKDDFAIIPVERYAFNNTKIYLVPPGADYPNP